ncbi:MAG: hypothetical protein JNL58_22200 [Planctomyces sp.]|nr:hypothetical protein [Planctomyces sp.]
MKSLLSWLERRFGRFAIPNVTLFIIAGQALVLMAALRDVGILERLDGNVAAIRGGDWHRIVTFLFMPPGLHPVWAFLFWYLFYLMGSALEGYWSVFRYNMFLLIGYTANVAAGMLLPDGHLSNWFLQGTVFLAFAWLNPNFVMYIFFILPVKIKWLALLTWIGFGLTFIFGEWSARLGVAASVLNFFCFFGSDVWYRMRSGQRHMTNQVKRFTEKPPAFLHKCTVCGITDKTHPQMDFRYCSRCATDACYCSEHLRSHEHIS